MQEEEENGGPSYRVGINAHLLSGSAGYRRAGIHQYIYQVVRHLAREEQRWRFLIYTRLAESLLQQSGIAAVTTRWPTEKRIVRILWEQLVWPWQARQARVDLLHSMAFVTPIWAPCPTVVTVYDLSFEHFPDRFPRAQQWYLRSQTRRSCRRARRIITISEASRQDVHRFYGIPLSQIDVILPGVDPIYKPLPETAVAQFRREKGLGRFILHVGTLQPRKNLPTLLEAFAHWTANGGPPTVQLVLVGGKGWLFDEIFKQVQSLRLEKRVLFTGYVADEELPFWYNAAELLVFPSVYEGFGMPIVEAMACGTPVIAANCSSIPEAVGDAGLLFPPQEAAALAQQMARLISDSALQETLRAKGLARAKLFSWARAGRETGICYQRALTKPNTATKEKSSAI
jgi:glycosyltransferase involved in cell wall biosynthesis